MTTVITAHRAQSQQSVALPAPLAVILVLSQQSSVAQISHAATIPPQTHRAHEKSVGWPAESDLLTQRNYRESLLALA